MRNLKRQKAHGKNPLWHMYHYVRIVKIFKQTVIIEICRYLPIVKLKHWMYRKFLKMNIGVGTAFAFKVVPDLLYPEYITIGKNCVIGYNTNIILYLPGKTHLYIQSMDCVIGRDGQKLRYVFRSY